MEVVNYLEESGLLNKGVAIKNQNEVKEPKGEFLGMLAATLGATLLPYMISKAIMPEQGVIRAGDGEIETSWGLGTIMSPHPLSNSETQKYYQNEHKFMTFIQEITYLK